MKETTRIAICSLFALMVLAVAAPIVHQFTRSHCSGPGKTRAFCMANLKQIDGAKNTWALEHEKTTNDVPTDSDIFGTNLYVKTKPTCGLGVYSLGRVGDRPKCSIPDHNAW